MMNYASLSHWLARPMSAAILATLTPEERKERLRAQQRLSHQRKRAKPPFAIHDVQPPPRPAHRDWLVMDDPTRDIIRV